MYERLSHLPVKVIDSKRTAPYIASELYARFKISASYYIRKDDGSPEEYESGLYGFMGKISFAVIHAVAEDYQNLTKASASGKHLVVLARSDKYIVRQEDKNMYRRLRNNGIAVIEKPDQLDSQFFSRVASALVWYFD